MSQIALITGTSTGIGLSTAVQMAQAGFTVVATMRNLEKAAALETRAREAGVTVHLKKLDVQDDLSVTGCVSEVLSTFGKIDVLVNNAGAGFLGSLEQTPSDALRQTMEVNFFGVWRVTQAVFPSMRAAHTGRIISISSIGGLIGQPFNDAYCAAKFAVEGMMECLAPVAKRFGVHITLVEPGPVNTEFVANVREKVTGATQLVSEAYAPLLDAYLKGTNQVFATIGQTSDDIGKVILEAATVEAPHFRYVTSELVQGLVSRKYVDPTGDSVVAMSGARLP